MAIIFSFYSIHWEGGQVATTNFQVRKNMDDFDRLSLAHLYFQREASPPMTHNGVLVFHSLASNKAEDAGSRESILGQQVTKAGPVLPPARTLLLRHSCLQGLANGCTRSDQIKLCLGLSFTVF